MATLSEILDQSAAIANYHNRIRTEFNKSDSIRFFVANRDQQSTLVADVQAQVKSWRLILDGYAEKLAQMDILQSPPILPLRSEIPRHEQGWLSDGDIIVGWLGYLVDRPRVAVSQDDSGVSWRYLDEDSSITRSPTRNDKFLTNNGWQKPPLTANTIQGQIDEIHTYQATELAALQGYFEYFRDKQYLQG